MEPIGNDGAMAAQYGPHRWSAGYHDDGTNEELRGTTFLVKDLSGSTRSVPGVIRASDRGNEVA